MQSFKFLRYALIGFEISPFSGQNRVILGGRGGLRFFFLIGILLFCYLGAHAKFRIPTICPYWVLKFPHFPVKIGLFWGVGGVPEFFFLLESSYFCYLGAHAKFQIPTICPSWRFSRRQEERERRRRRRK